MDGTTSINSHGAMTPERDRPGAHSTGLPPHDNDRSHITGIHVMPTYQEIVSNSRPYLPAADPSSWHLSGTSGRFDQQFRLLREENVGQIRDACQETLDAANDPGLEVYRHQRTSTHFHFCDDAKVKRITMHKESGIEFTVAFKQPEPVRNLTDEERRVWWEQCNRFQPGTLVCVLDRAGYIIHFVVSGSTLRGPWDVPDDLRGMDRSDFNLSSDREWSYVNLRLVESSKINDALRWYADTKWTHYFLDFPHVTLSSFKYTLEALQRDCQSPHRLVSVLNPDPPDTRTGPVVAGPAYARSLGFTFDLTSLMQNEEPFELDPRLAPVQAAISSFAGLRPDQSMALLESLSREVALIGALPGTGKSYLARKIIKALLHNREKSDLGPIVCVFHNDAALDNAVAQLLDDGIERIVRMGGSSTSERLQSLNLPATTVMFAQEKRIRGQMREALDNVTTPERLQSLGLPGISYTELCGQESGVEQQMAEFLDKLVSDILWELSRFFSCASEFRHFADFGAPQGDWSENYPSPEYYQQMLENWRDSTIQELRRANDEYEEVRSELPRFDDDARRQTLQDAHVVAVTTTELARRPELLQPTQAKVLVCDDAGDFQESQILTVILPSTEHIILLGNLTVQSERLQRMNSDGILDPSEISFFERLVNAAPDRCSRLSSVRTASPIGEFICGKSHPDCAHSCQRPYHGDSECGPCKQPCDVRCSHRRCEKLCYESCTPCTEDDCASGCPHSKCTMPCAAPCNHVPCSRRCPLLLSCWHQCPSLCGEACPDSKYCQTCGPEDIRLTPVIDSSGMKDYRDINLDEDPCIFPRCGHFQTTSFMDEQLQIQDFYNLTDEGEPSSIKGVLRPFSIEKDMGCTKCRKPFGEISRYGRIIRPLILDESLKEHLDWRNSKFCGLAARLTRSVPASNRHMAYRGLSSTSRLHQNRPIELNGNMLSQIHALMDLDGEGRCEDLAKLFKDIHDFSWGELKRKEMIYNKVFDSMRRSNENENATAGSTDTNSVHTPSLKLGGNLFAMDLRLRCNIAALDDFLRVWKRDSAASASAFSRPVIQFDLTSNFGRTREFISCAQEANWHMLAAQGHVYLAWYYGFALALAMDAPGPAAARHSQPPVSEEDSQTNAEEHLAKAEEIYKNFPQTSRALEDGIEATRDFIRSGNLGSLRLPRTLWYTNLAGMFDGAGPWYVCPNGHPFMDLRKPSMFLGQLLCTECGLIVPGRGDVLEDGLPLDTDVARPPEGETLVDI